MILARLALVFAVIAYGSSNSMSGTFQTCSLECTNQPDEINHPTSNNNFRSASLLRGKSGPRGEKGTVGRPGAKGVQGEKGADGKQGVKGSQGEKGDIGPQGMKGDDGVSFNKTLLHQLQQRITELESDATARQFKIEQLERESDLLIKKLRPHNCSQIKEQNPAATTGQYATYQNMFSIGKEVTCNMSSEGVEIFRNCQEILNFDPTSSDGVYTININPSTTTNVRCDMSSEGVEIFRNCQEILNFDPSSSDGVYTISINPSTTIDVYCDMAQGGWTVFQKRFDGSENFRRNFKEYSEGFGDPSQEHWLGLNNIHQLTSQPGYNSWILRVDLESFEGETAYAQYEDFNVGAGTYYTLSIGSYSGTAGDSMRHNNGAPFTTYDRSQYEWNISCADSYNGAWWFSKICGYSSLNAHVYNDNRHSKGMNWYHWKRSWTMPMKSTVMKMKPIM